MPDTITAKPQTQTHEAGDLIRRLPFTLVPLNIPGAYTTPAPPDEFDPNTASQSDLIKHGLLWRKPSSSDPPSMVKAWQRAFSRKWLAKDRIVPHLEPHPGKTHLLRGVHKGADASYYTNAWAGSVIRGTWTTNLGTWVVPTVSKPPEPQGSEGGWHMSTWVGIDGFNISNVLVSNDVLQAGIDQHVNGNGVTTSCFAWIEWYAPPQANSPFYIYETAISNFPVSPGQTVYCSVQYVNNNTAGALYFANDSTGQHFPITLAPPPGASFKGNVMEWIAEAPDGGEPTSSLPRFTPVRFTGAIGCGPNSAVGDPSKGDIVNAENASNKVLTSVSTGTDQVTISFIG